FALAGVHIVLILLERYLGGVLVYVPIVMGMLYFAGVKPIYLLALMFYAGVAAGIPIVSTYFSVQPQLLDLHPMVRFFVSSAQTLHSAAELLFVTTSLIFALWW